MSLCVLHVELQQYVGNVSLCVRCRITAIGGLTVMSLCVLDVELQQ